MGRPSLLPSYVNDTSVNTDDHICSLLSAFCSLQYICRGELLSHMGVLDFFFGRGEHSAVFHSGFPVLYFPWEHTAGILWSLASWRGREWVRERGISESRYYLVFSLQSQAEWKPSSEVGSKWLKMVKTKNNTWRILHSFSFSFRVVGFKEK